MLRGLLVDRVSFEMLEGEHVLDVAVQVPKKRQREKTYCSEILQRRTKETWQLMPVSN